MKTFAKISGIALAAALLASAAQATTYNVNLTVGAGGVTGTIDTDGTLGVLTTANITDWSLMLNDGSTFLLDGAVNSQRVVIGNAFTATASGLFFDFSAANGSAVDFQNPNIGSGVNYFCFNNAGISCSGAPVGMVVRTTGTEQQSPLRGVQQIASAAAVPEPATWALMIGGFGLAGAALRRRRLVAA